MEPVTSPAQKNCQGSTIKIISDETTSRQQPPNPHHQPSIPWMFHPHSLQMALNSSLVSPSLYSTLICQPNKHLVHAEETFLQPKEQFSSLSSSTYRERALFLQVKQTGCLHAPVLSALAGYFLVYTDPELKILETDV